MCIGKNTLNILNTYSLRTDIRSETKGSSLHGTERKKLEIINLKLLTRNFDFDLA